MATYNVFTPLKDASGSPVSNSDAIALFLCAEYDPPSSGNTVIVSDMSQAYTSSDFVAHLVLAFRNSNAEVTSSFSDYGFDSSSGDERTETINAIKQLDLSSLHGYKSEMGSISDFTKFIDYKNTIFGYMVHDNDNVRIEITVDGGSS